MKTMLASILLVSTLGSAAAIAHAQSTDSAQSNGGAPASPPATARQGGLAKACRADIETLCAGLKQGDGRLGQCLRTNRSKLSSQCTEALKERLNQRKQS